MPNVRVPTDDGSIQQALAELQEKMGAWSAALNEVQTSLAGRESLQAEQRSSNSSIGSLQANKQASETIERVTRKAPDLPMAPSKTLKPATEPIVKTEETPGGSTADDETLLASLDKETADKIRIMRRMSLGNKSVRELLEEINQTSPKVDKASRKSGWLKR